MSTITPAVIIGEQVAGDAAKTRKQLEGLIKSLNKSTFDVGELLYKIRTGGFYTNWGFTTFQEYVSTLDIKTRKAQYLTRIVDVMTAVGVERAKYEPLGIAKLREITSLDPDGSWINPETKEETPLKEFITGFVEKAEEMSLEDLKTHVRTLKGFVGENDFTWLNISVNRSVMDNTIRPALELAKNHIGSVGKDEEGVSKDASDGAAFEVIAVEFLNNPSNQVLLAEPTDASIVPTQAELESEQGEV